MSLDFVMFGLSVISQKFMHIIVLFYTTSFSCILMHEICSCCYLYQYPTPLFLFSGTLRHTPICSEFHILTVPGMFPVWVQSMKLLTPVTRLSQEICSISHVHIYRRWSVYFSYLYLYIFHGKLSKLLPKY